MIEHSLYFFLGFFLATLLALAVLPAFWRRAYRLTRREVEATLPLSPREIAAERDQLRAKFAVERLQMEQQIIAIGAKRHQDMKVTGEKAVRISELDDTVLTRNADIHALKMARDHQDTLLAQTQLHLEQVRADLAESIRSHEAKTEEAQKSQAELESSITLSQNQTNDILTLKSNMAAQFQRVEELATLARGFKEELKRNHEESKGLERNLRESEKDRAALQRRLDVADELALKRDATVSDREIKLSSLQDKLTSITSIAKEIDTAYKQELRKTSQHDALLRAREETITRIREDSSETARDLTRTIEKIRIDRHKLQSELSETRAKVSLLQRELNALKRLSSVSDLRVSKTKEMIVK